MGTRATGGAEAAGTLVRTVFVLMTVGVLLLSARPARGDTAWYASLYTGQFSGGNNSEMVDYHHEPSYFTGLGLIWEFDQSPPHVRWDLEGQVLQHFGDQDYTELTFSINVRWVAFPWNDYVPTTVGFGSGLSYTTVAPAVEARANPDSGATRTLHYLFLEGTFGLPQIPNWSLVIRAHHRSGMWGLFDGVGSASNFIVFGVRYRF